MIKNKKLINILLILPSILVLVVIFGAAYLLIEDSESKAYELNDKLHKLGKDLYSYKQKNGRYPDNVAVVNNTDKLCVKRIFTSCKKVYYKVSKDRQSFKMAVKSFTWPVLYLNSEAAMPALDGRTLTEKESMVIEKKYGFVCYFCMAYPENEKNPEKDMAPLYRKDSKVFPNPDDWPKLE